MLYLMALHKQSVVLSRVDRSLISGCLIPVSVKTGFFDGFLLKKFHMKLEKQIYLPFDTLQILTSKTSPVKSQAAGGRQAAETALIQSQEGTYRWRTFCSGLL